ncbi:MAG: carboxyl-terminal processing protease [Cryomorphaceae bacterium]|jgi:carboxyl-terminal processing protease
MQKLFLLIDKAIYLNGAKAFFLALLVVSLINPAKAQTEEAEAVTNQELADGDLYQSDQTPLPLDQIKSFAEIFTRIKRSYVEPVTDEQLLDYAIEGMLNGLDPHSVYMKADRYEELNEGTTGQFGGLGMEVIMEDGFVKVVTPIDDTPAAEAGIQTGDLIIRIDGKTVSGLDLQDATDQMRGEPGTSIVLTILRESTPEPFDVELERAIVRFASVKRKRLSDQIGYLRVTQFQAGTSESFRKELKQLRQIEEFSGLIIDLRNNPGGLLNSAISIADAFVQEGPIVSTKGRDEANDQDYMATSVDLIDGKPVVVLINGGSASASEIVAGALQDHKRALILGTQSFGKGSVQTVMNVGEQEGIKLTTARYYTPSGNSIQASGILPDVIVEQRQFKELKDGFKRIKENDLPRHLENDSKSTPKKSDNKNELEISDLLAKDYQLNEAFNLLNGLVMFQQKQQTPPVQDKQALAEQ